MFNFQSFPQSIIMSDMDTQIYLVVGGKVKATPARIVGKLAEVRTEYGIREFGVFYMSAEEAQDAIRAKKSRGKEGSELRSPAAKQYGVASG